MRIGAAMVFGMFVATFSMLSGSTHAEDDTAVQLAQSTKTSNPKDAIPANINFGDYHALVIGIDNYKNIGNLKTAVADAKAIAKVLKENYGFKVTLMLDPLRDDIVDKLDEFRATLKFKDNFLIYYAGHGWLDEKGDEGYWLAADAKDNRRSKWVSNATLTNTLKSLEAKHVMVISDSCYSGRLVRGISVSLGTPKYLQEMSRKKARVVITSGGLEPVADSDGSGHSPFTNALLKALTANKGVMEGNALFNKIRRPVMVNADQTPQYSDVKKAGHEGGDFLFVRKDGSNTIEQVAAVTPQPSPSLDKEAMFWDAIKSSTDAADFKDYVTQFPNGTFVGLAKRRIKNFKQSKTASLTRAKKKTLSFTVSALDEEMVALKTANVRSEPSVKGSKIAKINIGGKVNITGKTVVSGNNWFRVALAGGKTGYVFGTLLGEERAAAITPMPKPASRPNPVKPAGGTFMRPGTVFRDCAGCPEMVVIPSGSFRMGDLNGGGDKDEKPVHRVTIPKPFAVGKFEVTQAEWRSVMGNNPSNFNGDRKPVENVNWDEAKDFVRKLSSRTGKQYRLLSEAEWEYAARAGTTTKYSWGNTENGCGYANGADLTLRRAKPKWDWNSNCDDGYGESTAPAGSFKANAFGLHDMHGNVWEWVEDCWSNNYKDVVSNGSPQTQEDCSKRVLRGGSWDDEPRDLRSADRFSLTTDLRDFNLGFRIARTL